MSDPNVPRLVASMKRLMAARIAYDTESGFRSCQHCLAPLAAFHGGEEKHNKNCPYVEAKQLIAEVGVPGGSV